MITKFTCLFSCFLFFMTIKIYPQKTTNANTSLALTVSADIDCDNRISEKEARINFFTATIQRGDFTSTLSSGRMLIVNFTNLLDGLYTVSVTYMMNSKTHTQSFTTTIEKDKVNNFRPIVNMHCNEKNDPPKDTSEVIIKPKCGKWFNTLMNINNFNLAKGDLDIKSNDIVVARLKARFEFDLDYRIVYLKNKKEVTEKCKFTYKVRYPNGRVVNHADNFDLAIMEPGLYTIEYAVNCNDNFCVSGIKYIRCDEQIICNCGTPNETLQVTVRESKNITRYLSQKDSIIFNLSQKTWMNKTINCEGNICVGRSNYVIKDSRGTIIKSNALGGRFNPKLIAGNFYTLEIVDICGSKNCNTYTYNMRVIDSAKTKIENGFRFGIHADAHLNTPDFNNLSNKKTTVNGMIGLIGDLKLDNKQKWHLWPSINLVWFRYSGSNVAPLGDFTTKYKNLALELGLDLSYVLIRKNEKALHIYIGAGADFEFTRKENFSGNLANINNWKLINATSNENSTNIKASIGLLYEINKKWMLGVNYYSYEINKRKDMLLTGQNQGGALRLAYFFNRSK